MKRRILAVLMTTSHLLAHPGPHDYAGKALVDHLVSSPWHVICMLLLLAGVWGGRILLRRLARKSKGLSCRRIDW